MQDDPSAALVSAYQFHQRLQAGSAIARQRYRWQQWGFVGLSTLAAGLAVWPCLTGTWPAGALPSVGGRALGLVLAGLGLTVLGGVFHQRGGLSWQGLAAGAASVERAIYLHRTLLQALPERDPWLTQQVAQVQQRLQALLGNSWGQLPLPDFSGKGVNLADLDPDAYLQQRLLRQQPSAQQLAQSLTHRRLYQLATLAAGGLIVLLPWWGVTGMGLSAIAATLGLSTLWLAVDLNPRIAALSQVQQGLAQLQDYWRALSNPTGAEFAQLVMAVESLLVLPYPQLEAAPDLTSALQKPPDLLQQMLEAPQQLARLLSGSPTPDAAAVPAARGEERASAASDETIEASVKPAVSTPPLACESPRPAQAPSNGQAASEPAAGQTAVAAEVKATAVAPTPERGRPHVFVVMPFGRKQGADGRWYNFNRIYEMLIKPAIEAANFEAFRADEEATSGDILTDMFQELLLADMVVADLSIDNANAFYELGIRHALRRRGVVHIQAGRAYMPFDIFNVRTLPYHCDDTGCPDPASLEKDKKALTKLLQNTWNSDRNQVHSPIFNLLSGLVEPDRKTLQTPLARGYWQEYTNLQGRISTAQRQKRIGDVVLLAEEVSNPLIKEDIIAEAGMALRNMGNSALALKEYRQGLKLNPENVAFRCEEAFHLSRLGQYDEAIVKLEQLLQDVPHCVDAAAKLARIYKDLWKQEWEDIEAADQRLRKAYESSFLLQKAIANYLRGFQLDQNQYYPGINALSMTALLDHMATAASENSGDEDEMAYRRRLPMLKGAVQFCLESSLQQSANDPWIAFSKAELTVCAAETPQQVATAYRKALALLWNNRYILQAALEQLHLMELLGFRPEYVGAGIAVLRAELERYGGQNQLADADVEEERAPSPEQVFLFSGHMIDRADRSKPRFPALMEPEAARQIESALDKLNADANCIGIVPGLACGGDILFVEACLKRNMRLEAYLPFDPSTFIQESVGFAGDIWVERFYAVLNHPNVVVHQQLDRLGPLPPGDNPFERNNRWTLYSTLTYNIKAVRLIVLWDGQGGNGPGGTADMVRQVRQLGGIVEHLDTTQFDYWKEQPGVNGLPETKQGYELVNS